MREQFVDVLQAMGDASFAEAAAQGSNDELVYDILDFFDDCGVLDNPEGMVGHFLYIDEVKLVRRLAALVEEVVANSSLESWKALSPFSSDLAARLVDRT
ncbi:hypothetical protein [Myceligenerans indicum]|uniref:Uncharacterized protein n=1 Tax=Myceligenerans indicum TaxID=2593663 RepID=A0ABS1LRN4_9MICO|nr:hypothetical protein [Myceligenerans indicum]MBL0888951.1 hypothetical protein [Myceligenerans indicum]